jgi:hypothetical protein
VRVVGLLLVAACAAKAPASNEPHVRDVALAPKGLRPALSHRRMFFERPTVDLSMYLPDFQNELRWPLTGLDHPTLEPRFPIAPQLAIGVDWQTLCVRGVHKRTSASQKDLLAYLSGWCAVLERDVDRACRDLKPLYASGVRGLAAAVPYDVANILVAQGGERAERLLSAHSIRDITTLDLLAASFIEVGSQADALAINRRATDADTLANDATQCRRLVKRIVMSDEESRKLLVEELLTLVYPPRHAIDPVCQRLVNKVRCWRDPAGSCFYYVQDEQLSPNVEHLLTAYYRWPRSGNYEDYWKIAGVSLQALDVTGGAELTVAAIERALQAHGDCPMDIRIGVHPMIDAIRRSPGGASFEARLARVETACPNPALPPPAPRP